MSNAVTSICRFSPALTSLCLQRYPVSEGAHVGYQGPWWPLTRLVVLCEPVACLWCAIFPAVGGLASPSRSLPFPNVRQAPISHTCLLGRIRENIHLQVVLQVVLPYNELEHFLSLGRGQLIWSLLKIPCICSLILKPCCKKMGMSKFL